MRVLITGIDGFTGVHLEKHLKEHGYDVYGTVIGIPTNERYFMCDITDKAQIDRVVESVKPNYVIHIAGLAHVTQNHASMIYDVNVIGSENLLQSLVDNGVKPKKILMASSATIYGNQGKETLDESMSPKPVNHYGCSKLAMEYMAANFFDRLDIILMRPFNYTGSGQDSSFLIPKITSHYREGKREIELGNLDVAREFNDVRDICHIYEELMLCHASSETVNICTGRAIPLMQIIDDMNEIAGYKINVTVNPAFVRENEIYILKGSTVHLDELIEYRPQYTIADTLREKYSCG
ncbi:MAG: GDP-mannose 4,6-dehydratase [Campylobacterota bacterium]|nr:GDP-mannose 4,6-dehydratase [Campylobacterota bacterium]